MFEDLITDYMTDKKSEIQCSLEKIWTVYSRKNEHGWSIKGKFLINDCLVIFFWFGKPKDDASEM